MNEVNDLVRRAIESCEARIGDTVSRPENDKRRRIIELEQFKLKAIRAYAAQEEQPDGWINVERGTPPLGEPVVMRIETGRADYPFYFRAGGLVDEDDWVKATGDWLSDNERVTHWIHLPEAPKEERE